MKPPPPIPHENGSTTPRTAAAATAASTALPPRSSTSIAVCVASGSTLAAAPPVPVATGCWTGVVRGAVSRAAAVDDMAARSTSAATAMQSLRTTSSSTKGDCPVCPQPTVVPQRTGVNRDYVRSAMPSTPHPCSALALYVGAFECLVAEGAASRRHWPPGTSSPTASDPQHPGSSRSLADAHGTWPRPLDISRSVTAETNKVQGLLGAPDAA